MSQTYRYKISAREGFIDAPSEAAARQYLTEHAIEMTKTNSKAVFLELSATPGMRVDVVERPKRGRVAAVVDAETKQLPGLQVPEDEEVAPESPAEPGDLETSPDPYLEGIR